MKVPPPIRRAMRILELEQAETPAIGDLAARVGLSPSHFSRQFAAALGESSSAYGRRIRLDHASSRMLFDPAPMAEISQLFGFENQPAFNRAFRRQHGAAPRAFIERLRRQRPAGLSTAPLREAVVRVTERPSEPAVARRFFGPDLEAHWRRFIADLPSPLAAAPRRAGLFYDLPAVTPPRHQRYDCAVAIGDLQGLDHRRLGQAGLDPIELPGGIHAEIDGRATLEEVGDAIAYLYGHWLRGQGRFAPEGDPMVHWWDDGGGPGLTATIRMRRVVDAPLFNLMPLDPALRPLGRR